MSMTIDFDEPTSRDVVELLEIHLAFNRSVSPPEHVHALDLLGLSDANVSFFVARDAGELLGVGALRDLGAQRAEIKSMHTAIAARGRGVGRALLLHLLDAARHRDVRWVGLETGSMDQFAPARRLYDKVGFVTCEPFGNYTRNPFSTCMSIDLADKP